MNKALKIILILFITNITTSINAHVQHYQNLKEIEFSKENFNKYDLLLKLFDKADIINEINQS